MPVLHSGRLGRAYEFGKSEVLYARPSIRNIRRAYEFGKSIVFIRPLFYPKGIEEKTGQ